MVLWIKGSLGKTKWRGILFCFNLTTTYPTPPPAPLPRPINVYCESERRKWFSFRLTFKLWQQRWDDKCQGWGGQESWRRTKSNILDHTVLRVPLELGLGSGSIPRTHRRRSVVAQACNPKAHEARMESFCPCNPTHLACLKGKE